MPNDACAARWLAYGNLSLACGLHLGMAWCGLNRIAVEEGVVDMAWWEKQGENAIAAVASVLEVVRSLHSTEILSILMRVPSVKNTSHRRQWDAE